MSVRIENALVFRGDRFEKGGVYAHNGVFTDTAPECAVIDAAGDYVLPGFTDLHFHGAFGADASDGDEGAFQTLCDYEAKRGVTQVCPAVMSLKKDDLRRVCKAAGEFRQKSGARFIGLNLEGPFLSPDKAGAQDAGSIIPPDIAFFEELCALSCGRVKLVSVAPERVAPERIAPERIAPEDSTLEFIKQASKSAVVSVAHTTADYETAMRAFEAGASQVTHLFNAMPPLHHRAPGVIGAAFDSADVRAELICDGVHIHPSVLRIAFELFGKRVVMISDSMRACGLPDGEYTLGGQRVFSKDGSARLADGTLAGSSADLMTGFKRAVSFGIPLEALVRSAAVAPAKALGIYDEYGSIESGKKASFIILSPELELKAVYIDGVRQ